MTPFSRTALLRTTVPILLAASAAFSTAATSFVTNGVFVGANGISAPGSAGPGSPAVIYPNLDLLISGGYFVGGQGGFATSITFPDPETGDPMTFGGIGGTGGYAVGLQGGIVTVTGGDFISGMGGGGSVGSGPSGGVIQIFGGANVLISGGTYTFGGGSSPFATFDVNGNSSLTLDGDFGAANGTNLTGSGTLTGRLQGNATTETYTYSVAPGSTLTITPVPEPATALLAAVSTLAILRRKR